jgi:hypothetical protein
VTQLDLLAECRVPEQGTVAYQILMALKQGQRLTPLLALAEFNCLSLSQRIGELKKMGWPITTEMVKVASGKSVAQYTLKST